MQKCARCNGKGYIDIYKDTQNGICFICYGDGYTFKNKCEENEFHMVKYLFNLDESKKQQLDINISIEEYFKMPPLERYSFYQKKSDLLDDLDDLIECGKHDLAAEAGYDSYEEYEEEMRLEAMLESDWLY